MAWSCFDFCPMCGNEHNIFIDQNEEPQPKEQFEYRCSCIPGLKRKFRYSPMYSEQTNEVPPGAILAHRVAPQQQAFSASWTVEAAGTAVSLHISAM